jgi:hypothetical protein
MSCRGGSTDRSACLLVGRAPLSGMAETMVSGDPWIPMSRDGFGSDTHGYKFRCHCLPYFISNSDTNTNIIEYEYKTDISNLDSHSYTYSIYNIES